MTFHSLFYLVRLRVAYSEPIVDVLSASKIHILSLRSCSICPGSEKVLKST